MSWAERLEQAQGSIMAALGSAVVAGFIWLVRRVLTNQKQNEMLRREIAMRDERRAEDRKAIEDALKDIKSDLKEVRDDVKILFRRGL